ncbi:hypothetical protein [Anatilimnocola floriformis]|uniref:hypothetical protein n=1 Tax=Anatilimnocola floriformis TaxID=2948575 RepID=UPI0020C564FE|nr:hypothetical protein [Anatilimnocola floriformis]
MNSNTKIAPTRLSRAEVLKSLEKMGKQYPAGEIRWGWSAKSSDLLTGVSMRFAENESQPDATGVLTGHLSFNAILCEDDRFTEEELAIFAGDLAAAPDNISAEPLHVLDKYKSYTAASRYWCTRDLANGWLVSVTCERGGEITEFRTATRDGGWFRVPGVDPESQLIRVEIRDVEVTIASGGRTFLMAAVAIAAVLFIAVAGLLRYSLEFAPSTRPPAVLVTIDRKDQLPLASGEGLEPTTDHVATSLESHSHWVVFFCDRQGIVQVTEGLPGKSGPGGSFRTPSKQDSDYAYVISVATNEKCPELLSCLRTGLTPEVLSRLQEKSFAKEDKSGKQVTAIFSEIADKCKCTRGLSTVSVLRRTISKPPVITPSK